MKVSDFFTSYASRQREYGLQLAVVSSALVFLLLFLVQPLDFNGYEGYQLLWALGLATVTLISQLVFFIGWRIVMRKRLRTILSAVIYCVLLSVLVFVSDSVFALKLWHLPLSKPVLLRLFHWGLIMSLFVGGINFLVFYNLFLHQRIRELLPAAKKEGEKKAISVTLRDQTLRGSSITLNMDDFLYAEVNRNNVSIHYLDDGGGLKTMKIRSTLSQVMTALSGGSVMQCHRSFIVNIDNVLSAKGNSNGYRLKLRGEYHRVPVSRSFVDEFVSRFRHDR